MMTTRRIAQLVPCLLLAACTTTSEPQNDTCTGTARPDQTPSYAGGVPSGLICANQIPPTDGGAPASPQNYCCTNSETTCA